MPNRKEAERLAALLDRLPLGAARAWSESHRQPLMAALLAIAAALAALLLPVRLPDEAARGDGRGALPPPMERAPAEDLGAFSAGRRWGISLQDIIDQDKEEAKEEAKASSGAMEQVEITPPLAEIGFVGLMREGEKHAVLLVLPDGRIARLAGGEALPDGRILASVAGHSLTLVADDGQKEVLALFPRLEAE